MATSSLVQPSYAQEAQAKPEAKPEAKKLAEVSNKDLFRYREQWPEKISIVNDISVTIIDSGETVSLKRGAIVTLSGVSTKGIKVLTAKGAALVQEPDTDLVEGIKSNAASNGVVVKFQGELPPPTKPEAAKPEIAKAKVLGEAPQGLAELFPGKLFDANGDEVSRDQLAGKFIGVYFSAHWCGPCRAFTPSLVKFRDEHKDTFEVVFVSSDRSKEAQFDYMTGSKMGWVTMSHRSAEATALSKRYQVRGIPSLVILDPTGKTITRNGRGDIGKGAGAITGWKKASGIDDPAKFAKKADDAAGAGIADAAGIAGADKADADKPEAVQADAVQADADAGEEAVALEPEGQITDGLAALLPEKIFTADGKEVSRDMLAGKFIGIYFSAHWCPPCRMFTPMLVEFRDNNKDEFEVVFASSDRSKKAQFDYMEEAKMKWYTLPLKGKESNAMSARYQVRGIPSLVILDPNGKTITKNGRNDVMGNKAGAIAAWKVASGIDDPSAFLKKAAPADTPAVAKAAPAAPAANVAPETPAAPVELGEGLKEILPETMIKADGSEVSRDALKGKIVGLYFAAYYSPPCRTFTKELVKFHGANNAAFEVVMVNFDRGTAAQQKFMTSYAMPWPALKNDDPACKALKEKFGVKGYPALIVLGPDGKILSKEGRMDVSIEPDGALMNWKMKQ